MGGECGCVGGCAGPVVGGECGCVGGCVEPMVRGECGCVCGCAEPVVGDNVVVCVFVLNRWWGRMWLCGWLC